MSDGIRLAAVVHTAAMSDWNAAAIQSDIKPFVDAFQQRGRSYMSATIVLQVAAALKLTREPVLYAALTGKRDGVERAQRGDVAHRSLLQRRIIAAVPLGRDMNPMHG